MMKTLYLAETSKTYRQWIPRLVEGAVREVVDLWDSPADPLAWQSGENLLIVDEAFLAKGPGPACTVLASLLEPRRIVSIPIILLRRREQRIRELSPRIFQLRRPFLSSELESVLNQLCPEGRELKEVVMSENYTDKGAQPAGPIIDEQTLQRITREAIEKVVREMVPGMAEKIVKEEIRRLTE